MPGDDGQAAARSRVVIQGKGWSLDNSGLVTGPKGKTQIAGKSERLIFATLIEIPGWPIPYERMLDRLWGSRPDGPARKNLDVVVCRIRAKFKAIGIDDIIGTARGIGYFLNEIRSVEMITHSFTPEEWKAVKTCVAIVGHHRPELAAKTGIDRVRH